MSSFGSRDLALLLPDQVGDPFSLRHSTADENTQEYQPVKPKIDPSKKVVRYFRGKAPVWIQEDDKDDDGGNRESKRVTNKKAEEATSNSSAIDPRLARLARLSANTEKSQGEEKSTRRRRVEAQVIIEGDEAPTNEEILNNSVKVTDESDEKEQQTYQSDDENAEEIKLRRERILAKINEKQDVKVDSSDDESESENESEYETDTDVSSEEDNQPLLKPIFIPKHLRQTVKDKQTLQAEEELKMREKLEQENERKQQAREKLAESIRRAEEAKVDVTDMDSDAGIPDDTDDPDDSIEFENWKIRELSRLKRDALLREKAEIDKRELERRRNMTEEERLAEDQKLGIGKFKEKEKEKWKFMQRYYHKGVFYMDEDSVKKAENDVRTRNYAEPTLEDRIDKEKLPAVMQVKKFGMRGRTKYTHLVDQDTTEYKNPLRPEKRVIEKYMMKRSGVGDIDNDARAHKKSKTS